MNPGLYSAATALNAGQLNQEVVAQNLAHMDVPGYRRRVVALSAFEQVYQQSLSEMTTPTGLGTQVSDVQTDFTAGAMQTTGRSLDVAIDGDGFFVVDGPDGALYTRKGVFQLTADGELVTTEGMPVRGTGGPLVMPATVAPSEIQIGRDGTIRAGGQDVGQLELATFADNRQLLPVGTTLFEAPAGTDPGDGEVTVHQGVREMSNVTPVEELVRMIVGLRHYEAAQRALTTLAESVGHNTNPQSG